MKEAILRLSLQGWLFAHMPVGWSGKMCPVYSQAGKEAILPPSYRFSQAGKSQSQRPADGERQGSSPQLHDSTAWVGECLTLNIPEWNNFRGQSRSEGDVSSLSEVLVRGKIAPKYFLTAKCAAGILRRAERLAKRLPEVLEKSLKALVAICAGGTERKKRTR